GTRAPTTKTAASTAPDAGPSSPKRRRKSTTVWVRSKEVMNSCSPHEAKRNAGAKLRQAWIPDFASLHPGYGLPQWPLMQTRPLEEPGAVAGLHRDLEGAAVAIDQQRHVDAGIAERPDLAEHGGEFADLAARDGEHDVAGMDVGGTRRATRGEPDHDDL